VLDIDQPRAPRSPGPAAQPWDESWGGGDVEAAPQQSAPELVPGGCAAAGARWTPPLLELADRRRRAGEP